MGGKKKYHPRGALQCPRGERTESVGMIKSALLIVLMLGILMTGLSVQTIRSEAAASCQSSQEDGIPEDIKKICDEIGAEFNICPELLEAMAYHESRFIPDVTNKNCYGLLQVNVKIHKDRMEKYGYTKKDMLKAYPNILVAADYLAELYDTYGDDNPVVLSLYSGAGWKAVEKYKEYGFLTDYVDDVLTRSEHFERIHGK